MHELGVALEILKACRARTPSDAARIEHVTVAIGELSAIEPELLRFAWEAATRGTPDEGATLEVRWCPARQTCEACGVVAERAEGGWLRLCPRCGAPLRIEGGDELDLERFRYADEAPAPPA